MEWVPGPGGNALSLQMIQKIVPAGWREGWIDHHDISLPGMIIAVRPCRRRDPVDGRQTCIVDIGQGLPVLDEAVDFFSCTWAIAAWISVIR